MARLEVPVVVLASSIFASTARQVRAGAGIRGLPLIALPNPMEGLTREQIVRLATDVSGDIAATLTGGQ